jgi:hypothetical protein
LVTWQRLSFPSHWCAWDQQLFFIGVQPLQPTVKGDEACAPLKDAIVELPRAVTDHHRLAQEPMGADRTPQRPLVADLLLRRFARATRQWGLDEAREGLDCGRFVVPEDGKARAAEAQMSLL